MMANNYNNDKTSTEDQVQICVNSYSNLMEQKKARSEKIKVALLWSSYDGTNTIFKDIDVLPPTGFLAHNPNPEVFTFEIVPLRKATALQQILRLVLENRYEMYFNICDGEEMQEVAGAEVSEFIIRKNLLAVCPSTEFYLMTKCQMKVKAQLAGILTTKYYFVYSHTKLAPKQMQSIIDYLKFPMIVKQYNSHGSDGMTQLSRVHDRAELEMQIYEMTKKYGGALIEEFITGREFTVLVAENASNKHQPIIYTPFECKFKHPSDFKHFDQKFIDFDQLHWIPIENCELEMKLKAMTSTMFLACHGNSFARCDYRMSDETGEIYFLEINILPAIFCSEDYGGSADLILNHCSDQKSFVKNLIVCAYQSWNRRRHMIENVTVKGQNDNGFVSARKNVSKNDVIVDLTNLPNKLVNRSEYEHWPKESMKYFMATSVPLGANLRIWLVNNGRLDENFEITLIKRGPKEFSNCTLDSNLRLIATKEIFCGEMLILDEKFT